jgi:hypothetical protein
VYLRAASYYTKLLQIGIVFASANLIEKLAENLDIPIFVFFLTYNSIYYNNIMLERIEKTIIQNIEFTMDNIKKGNSCHSHKNYF